MTTTSKHSLVLGFSAFCRALLEASDVKANPLPGDPLAKFFPGESDVVSDILSRLESTVHLGLIYNDSDFEDVCEGTGGLLKPNFSVRDAWVFFRNPQHLAQTSPQLLSLEAMYHDEDGELIPLQDAVLFECGQAMPRWGANIPDSTALNLTDDVWTDLEHACGLIAQIFSKPWSQEKWADFRKNDAPIVLDLVQFMSAL